MGSSFYGNVKLNAQSAFTFDAIYPNRKKMETQMQNDKIFLNRFVLVDYHYAPETSKKWVDRYTSIMTVNAVENLPSADDNTNKVYFTLSDGTYYKSISTTNNEASWIPIVLSGNSLNLAETDEYSNNRKIDQAEYGNTYDGTIWMKVFINNQEGYLLIGKINDFNAPTFDLIIDAPATASGAVKGPEIDYLHSGALNYRMIIPGFWNFDMKPESVTGIYNVNRRIAAPTTSYGQINSATNICVLSTTKSGILYPSMTYQPVILTNDSYEPNRYYIKNGNDYIKSSGAFIANTQYYTITQINNDTKIKDDTKELNIRFDTIGNIIDYLYNTLYGLSETATDSSPRKRFKTPNELKTILNQSLTLANGTTAPVNLTTALEITKELSDRASSANPWADWYCNNNNKNDGYIANRPLQIRESSITSIWAAAATTAINPFI